MAAECSPFPQGTAPQVATPARRRKPDRQPYASQFSSHPRQADIAGELVLTGGMGWQIIIFSSFFGGLFLMLY